MEERFEQAFELMKNANRIVCISHKRPDGDTIGAAISMYHVLKGMGKDNVELACIDEPSDRFSYLPGLDRYKRDFNFLDYDLMVVLDAGASYMTRFHEKYPDIFSGKVPVLNIDHHASNDDFGTCNIVDENAASTTVVLYRMFSYLDIKITPVVATALLTGIYFDTGSFMHSNTTLEVFEVAQKLLEAGGKYSTVAKNLFKSSQISTMKLWGRVLENVKVNAEGVTISVVTSKDFEELGAGPDDVSGVIDLLNSVPGAKYSCLLNEDKNGYIKGSFRTQRDDVDVAELAAKFGGGGHKKAAGFTMKGRLHREINWKITPAEQPKMGEYASDKLQIKA